MTDNEILSYIRYCGKLNGKFHRLPIEQRREVIAQAAGRPDEKLIIKIINRIKRNGRKGQ
jgi:hypothetical protein